ncbi:MAG: alpha/beta hydrolase [Gammaproteobacteria bacterium]|nr:alpha/beta hydrolase [Gammaproteobacteria bacterium]
MASPESKKLLELLWKNYPGPSDYEKMKDKVGKMRDNFVQATKSFAAAPAGIDIQAVDVDGVPGEWVCAPGVDQDRVLLYLHGGGYVIGSIQTHKGLIAALSRAANCRALALDYRLAPEHRYPAAVEDATKAYRWLLAQGYKPGKISIAGDSAGGGLTLATLVALRDAGTPLPGAAVPISPWTDLEGTGESMRTKVDVDPMVEPGGLFGMARIYLGDADPRQPTASPLYADMKGLPPLLIQVGDLETLLDDATRTAANAKAAGVDVTLEVWPEMVHVWHLFAPMVPEGRAAIARIGQFIAQHTD